MNYRNLEDSQFFGAAVSARGNIVESANLLYYVAKNRPWLQGMVEDTLRK